MSEKKSTNKTAELNDNIRDNTLRVVDEIAKVQPQMGQSLSNLQHETIETSKNVVKTAFETQKQVASGFNVSVPVHVSEQIAKQSTEIANNFVRSTGIYNQLIIGALDATRENTKIFSKTFEAFTEYNNNIMNAWTSFWAAHQQQFIKA